MSASAFALPWKTLRAAMLPLDGSIHDLAPDILAAVDSLVPRRQWRDLAYVDLTAGSCLLPLAFAAAGVRRMVVNDVAPRSTIAAQALFGAAPLPPARLKALLAGSLPQRRHVPSFHFACDYLLEPVAARFDALFQARLPEGEARAARYLALLWVMGFAPGVHESFEILLTHDPAQLRDDAHDWKPYLKRLDRAEKVLAQHAAAIAAGQKLAARTKVTVHQRDMLDFTAADLPEGPLLVAINPPTRGIDEYVIDDQLVHSLIANRWLPLSRSRETNREFWLRRVRRAMRMLPKDALYMVYGGDGSMTWRECFATWSDFGDPQVVRRNGRGGWAIFRRR